MIYRITLLDRLHRHLFVTNDRVQTFIIHKVTYLLTLIGNVSDQRHSYRSHCSSSLGSGSAKRKLMFKMLQQIFHNFVVGDIRLATQAICHIVSNDSRKAFQIRDIFISISVNITLYICIYQFVKLIFIICKKNIQIRCVTKDDPVSGLFTLFNVSRNLIQILFIMIRVRHLFLPLACLLNLILSQQRFYHLNIFIQLSLLCHQIQKGIQYCLIIYMRC